MSPSGDKRSSGLSMPLLTASSQSGNHPIIPYPAISNQMDVDESTTVGEISVTSPDFDIDLDMTDSPVHNAPQAQIVGKSIEEPGDILSALKIDESGARSSSKPRAQRRAPSRDVFGELEALHEAEKAKRTRSPSPTENRENKKIKAASHEVAADETDDNNTLMLGERHESAWEPRIDFWKIRGEVTSLKCAISIDGGEVIGNCFGTTDLWTMGASIDGGRRGTPGLTLIFGFTADGRPATNRTGNFCTASWQPGVKIQDLYMMDTFFREDVDTIPLNEVEPDNRQYASQAFPSQLREQCQDPEKLRKLALISFQSNSAKLSKYDPQWPFAPQQHKGQGYDYGSVEAVMRALFIGNGSQAQVISIWFLVPDAAAKQFGENCLMHLEEACDKRYPPLHQYMDSTDGHGKVAVDLNMRPLQTFGDGMYIKHPVIRQASDGSAYVAHKNDLPTFYNFPKKIIWDTTNSFHVYQGVPVVREHQFVKAATAGLAADFHPVFLERVPAFEVEGVQYTHTPWFKTTFFAGVRINRNPVTGVRDSAVPAEGDSLILDFYNGVEGVKEHEVIKDQSWFGRVVPRPKAWFDATKTDFCAVVTKPRKFIVKVVSYKSALKVDSKSLPKALIEVRVDATSAKTKLKALDKFCDEKFHPPLLDEIRMAIMTDPYRNEPNAYGNLTEGPQHGLLSVEKRKANATRLESLVEKLRAADGENPEQIEVLEAAKHLRSNMSIVIGPPGTGKTKSLTDIVLALADAGHKVLICAAANATVDTVTTKIWKALTRDQRDVIKCLRLDAYSVENTAILKKQNYAAYQGVDASDLAENVEEPSAQDSVAIRNVLERAMANYAGFKSQMDELIKKYKDVNEALKQMQRRRSKVSSCPDDMALDFRIWELTEHDRVAAPNAYAAAKASMSDEEFQAKTKSGELTVGKFDESLAYRNAINLYVLNEGELGREQKREFEKALDAMFSRVLRDTQLLFCILSNVGGSRLVDQYDFQPTVICVDEAGQASVPALSVPLTTFKQWDHIYIYGDVSEPTPGKDLADAMAKQGFLPLPRVTPAPNVKKAVTTEGAAIDPNPATEVAVEIADIKPVEKGKNNSVSDEDEDYPKQTARPDDNENVK